MIRHVLVHDYYAVNLEMVWNILDKDLIILKDWLGLPSARTEIEPN